MKMVLPTVISEKGSAFMKERLIANNALIACEVLHAIKKRDKDEKGSV